MSTPSNGLKQLTMDNWSSIDTVWDSFYFGNPESKCREWSGRVLQIGLEANVPENVRTLFDVTRGILVYSLLYYPLLAVGDSNSTGSLMLLLVRGVLN